MLNEEILKLRKQLEESIKNEQEYDIIYKISVELDNAITRYYNKNLSKSKLTKNTPKK